MSRTDGVTSPVELDRLLAAVHKGGLLLPAGILEVLMLRGTDAADLLHRLSTNDILRPAPASPVRTLLTTEKGRIIDEIEVVRGPGRAMVICHAGALTSVASWIERFIISDDVEVCPVTTDVSACWTIGDKVPSAWDLTMPANGADGLPWEELNSPWPSALGNLPGFRCMVGKAVSGRMNDELMGEGMRRMDLQEFHLLRIAAGVPWYPSELNSEHNPLECGLREHVSFTKGCYVGQEVVARLDAYDKVQRMLGVFRIPEASFSPGVGTDVLRSGARVGMLTSVTPVLSDGSCLAMGFVERRESAGLGGLSVAGPDGPRPLMPWEPIAHPVSDRGSGPP